jgi:hypothetical protein
MAKVKEAYEGKEGVETYGNGISTSCLFTGQITEASLRLEAPT